MNLCKRSSEHLFLVLLGHLTRKTNAIKKVNTFTEGERRKTFEKLLTYCNNT